MDRSSKLGITLVFVFAMPDHDQNYRAAGRRYRHSLLRHSNGPA